MSHHSQTSITIVLLVQGATIELDCCVQENILSDLIQNTTTTITTSFMRQSWQTCLTIKSNVDFRDFSIDTAALIRLRASQGVSPQFSNGTSLPIIQPTSKSSQYLGKYIQAIPVLPAPITQTGLSTRRPKNPSFYWPSTLLSLLSNPPSLEGARHLCTKALYRTSTELPTRTARS